MSNLHYSQVKQCVKLLEGDSIEEHGKYIYKVIKKVKLGIGNEEREPGWYFIDETWSDFVGPYETKEACEEGLRKYVIHLEGGSS